jgi:hypothetical protein
MSDDRTSLPPAYREAVRFLIRYAIVMAVVGLLVGISFQESARKLPYTAAGAGLHVEAVLTLALVHGHVFVMAVIIPIVLAAAMDLALRVGGSELPSWSLRWLVRGYLPFAAAAVALQLVKGYHVLLAVRHGQTDLAAVDAAFLGGVTALRYGIYGVIHAGLGLSLGLFLLALWRSLGSRPR